jgi:hypothetical protein
MTTAEGSQRSLDGPLGGKRNKAGRTHRTARGGGPPQRAGRGQGDKSVANGVMSEPNIGKLN